MLKLVRCGKVGKTGEHKNPKYGLYKGPKNQDFMAKYSPLMWGELQALEQFLLPGLGEPAGCGGRGRSAGL